MFAPLARVIREAPLILGAVGALIIGLGLTIIHVSAVVAAAAAYAVGVYACLAAVLQRYPAHQLCHTNWPTLQRSGLIAFYMSPLYALAWVAPWALTAAAVVGFILGAAALTAVRTVRPFESVTLAELLQATGKRSGRHRF